MSCGLFCSHIVHRYLRRLTWPTVLLRFIADYSDMFEEDLRGLLLTAEQLHSSQFVNQPALVKLRVWKHVTELQFDLNAAFHDTFSRLLPERTDVRAL